MKIKFLQKKPFFIFEIENFLSDSEYKVLNDHFPNFEKIKLEPDGGSKFSFYSSDDLYKKLLNEDNKCIKLLEKKFDENFFLNIKSLLKKEIFIARKSQISDVLSLLRKTKIVKKKKDKNFIEKLFYSYYKYTFGFSYMFKDSFIQPHNDSPAKLISLMLYFPSEKLENLNIGTTFYDTKYKNFSNKQPNFFRKEQASFFKENFVETFTLPFKKKNLYCFIKSDLSWHSVKKLEIPGNEIRRSININLNI